MHTAAEWLQNVLSSPAKMEHWLVRQYIGETLAAERVQELANKTTDKAHKLLLEKIAADERTHALWVADLLHTRGIKLPNASYDNDRYWKEALKEDMTAEETYASGQLAEEMRLKRIRLLCASDEIAQDIQKVFRDILPDEVFHAKAFAALTTPEALETMRPLHESGRAAIGLIPE